MKGRMTFEGNLKIKYLGVEVDVTVRTKGRRTILSFYCEYAEDLVPEDINDLIDIIGMKIIEMKWRPRKKCMDVAVEFDEGLFDL